MSQHLDGNLIIRNGSILLPDGDFSQGSVLVESGVIREVGDVDSSVDEIDAAGCYVIPGLIDQHTHGLGRESVSECNLVDYAQLEAARGVTTFFPTLFAPPAEIALQMERHRRDTRDFAELSQFGGFRLESPYLAIASGGLTGDTSPISSEVTEMLMDAGGGHVKIWDVSPELDGAADFVRQVTARGVTCSIAHTHSTAAQARELVDAGARLVTHMFDVIGHPEMIDPDPDVYPVGLGDYLLIEDRVACEIIADGTHVHPHLVEKALRCKPDGKIVFVTDSNLGAGLPPGRYNLPGGWGNVLVQGSNDGVRIIDREMVLAGSALTMLDSFRNALRLFGRDLAKASAFCSRNPARILGLNKGEIEPGRDADLIVLNKDLELVCTISRGSVVYRKHMV